MFGYSDGEDSVDLCGWNDSEDWGFISEWFEALIDRVYVAERRRMDTQAVELGRDLENDVWIEIEHENGAMVRNDDELADDPVARYTAVREMIILTTILGEVDYEMWFGELRQGTRFSLPNFVDLRSNELPRKYAFAFYGAEDPDEYSWNSMQHVFGPDNSSTEFTEQFPLACEATSKHGLRWRR